MLYTRLGCMTVSAGDVEWSTGKIPMTYDMIGEQACRMGSMSRCTVADQEPNTAGQGGFLQSL